LNPKLDSIKEAKGEEARSEDEDPTVKHAVGEEAPSLKEPVAE
jgi:hypothetical protein